MHLLTCWWLVLKTRQILLPAFSQFGDGWSVHSCFSATSFWESLGGCDKQGDGDPSALTAAQSFLAPKGPSDGNLLTGIRDKTFCSFTGIINDNVTCNHSVVTVWPMPLPSHTTTLSLLFHFIGSSFFGSLAHSDFLTCLTGLFLFLFLPLPPSPLPQIFPHRFARQPIAGSLPSHHTHPTHTLTRFSVPLNPLHFADGSQDPRISSRSDFDRRDGNRLRTRLYLLWLEPFLHPPRL